MTGPWERYQSAAEGPWAKYGSATPQKPEPPDPSDGMSWLEKMAVGAGAAFDRAARGVIGAIPLIPEADKAEYLQQGKEDAQLYQKYHPGGFATAGEIGADVAMSAVPVARLTKTLAAMAPLGVFAPMVAANAGYAAATSPENRDEAAMWGGAGAGVGHALSKTIGRLVQPIQPTNPAIKEMVDAGVPLTPAQAGGRIAQTIEAGLVNLPFNRPLRQALMKASAEGSDLGHVWVADKLAKPLTDYLENPALQDSAIKAVDKARDQLKALDPSRFAAGASVVPITTIAALLHVPVSSTAGIAALAGLYGTAPGRRYLLGQTSFQQLLQEAPELAPYVAQVGRSIATEGEDR